METLLLNMADLKSLLTDRDIVETVETVLLSHGQGKVVMPPKLHLDMDNSAGFNAMPAHILPLNAAGMKWAGGFFNNASKGLPSIVALIILSDPQTGAPMAVMDGSFITYMRTGAVAVVAAKYIARKDAKKVALIGAGAVGWAALSGFPYAISTIEEVQVYDISPANVSGLINGMKHKNNLKITPAATVKEAVEDADIVITATAANEPLVSNDWLKKGVTAISLGTYQEFDEEFVLGADKIIVDSLDQCRHRGELKKLYERGALNDEKIYGNLGEAVDKGLPRSDSERILGVFIGMGSFDIALAKIAYQKALGLKEVSKFNFLTGS